VSEQPRGLGRVALTFDAEHPDRPWCPPGTIEHILDVLAERAVRATFFVQGRWAESQPDAARRIADEGHLVGHHSHYHARMPLFSDAGLDADLLEGAAAVTAATGRDPRPWFRCPFGSGHDDERVLAALDRAGYRNVHWDLAVADWEPWRTGPLVAADAIEGVRAHGDGAVVLLHAWPGGTGEGIEALIDGLAALDAAFVTVDALEDLP
jgi:peptidoglycan/xylan/chitin deacetylase (PgdA/CDA1 family)